MRIAVCIVALCFIAMAIACGGAGSNPQPATTSARAMTLPSSPPASDATDESSEITSSPAPTSDALNATGRREIPETDLERKYYIRMRSRNLDVLNPETMSVGDLGRIGRSVHIQQIVSDGVMLCRCDDQMFLLKGFSTRGAVDGRSISIGDSVVTVTGTQSYTTVQV